MRRREPWGVRAASRLSALAALRAGAAGPDHDQSRQPAGAAHEPIEELHYDDAKRCLPNPKRGPGAAAWLQRHWRGAGWGIVRCSKLSPHDFSVHAEGRALDWHLDAGVGVQRHAAMRLIDMLLATDRDGNEAALARRMGVQG